MHFPDRLSEVDDEQHVLALRLLEHALRDTLELRAADLARLEFAAHRLKGSLGTFGFAEASRRAAHLEQLARSAAGEAERSAALEHLRAALVDAAAGAPAAGRAAGPFSAPRRGRLLCVEDDPQISALIALALDAEGIELARADDGEDALAFLRSAESFDVVLLDVRLPGVSGLEVLERMRSDARLCSTPVVLLSAHFADGLAAQVEGDPATRYLRKPFAVEDLRSAVRLALSHGERP
jgi:CheY-like chemotaxis protein